MPLLLRAARAFARRAPTMRLIVGTATATAAASAGMITHAAPIKISAAEQEDLAASISEKLAVPFLPRSLRDVVVSKVVAAIIKTLEEIDLDEQTVSAIQQAAKLQSTGMDDKMLATLTEDVCRRIDVPLLDRAQERALVEQTVALALGDTSLLQIASSKVGVINVSFGRLVLDPSSRKAVAQRLNAAVDVPGLNEEQERVIFEKAVDFVGGAIDRLVPAEWRVLLDGLDADEIAQLQAATVSKLVEQAPLPLRSSLSDDKLKSVVAAAVDGLFNALLRSEIGGAALSLKEQLERLRNLEAEATSEGAFLARRAQRERTYLARKLQALEAQKSAIKEEIRRQRRWF